jgi:hypothetical protein
MWEKEHTVNRNAHCTVRRVETTPSIPRAQQHIPKLINFSQCRHPKTCRTDLCTYNDFASPHLKYTYYLVPLHPWYSSLPFLGLVPFPTEK